MSTHSTIRDCPICGDRAREVLHTQRFVVPDGHPLAGGYDVVACARCGFVFADTTVTQHDYDLFYAQFSKYEDAQTGTGGGDQEWDARRLDDTASEIAASLRGTEARILDIGCANGGLLAALQRRGYPNLVGLDPSPACARNTRERCGVEALAGSMYELPELRTFDCVVLSHVMEHLSDLRGAARVAAALLHEGGVLYVEVPDATRYADFIAAPFQDFNTEHINHFSHRSLTNLLHVTGLRSFREGAKDIESAPGVPYPALFGFYRKEARSSGSADFCRDDALPSRIRSYIEKSRALMQGMNDAIGRSLRQTPKIIVWGTGQLAMKLLAETCLATADITAFVDSNPINHGKRLRGAPIVSPESIRGLPEPILITSTIHQNAIAHTIREGLRLTNPIILLRQAPPTS